MPEEYQVVVQGSAEVPAFSELFYTQVKVNDRVELKGMMDSGSMTCTLNEEAERKLTESGALVGEPQAAERIVLVGCGGKQTVPKCVYDLTLTIYGVTCLVPVLVVPGQCDELIIGSNVLKHLMREMKCNDDYWKFVSVGCKQPLLDHEHFLDMMSCTTRWRGDKVPERIGTVKLPPFAQRELVKLAEEYEDIFSRHSLDCGKAEGVVHRIRLTDDRPFRMPYRRVPPAHYQQLRQVLTEMEEQGIIRKSVSEYASPLVMVWKKDGGLRICTDFRWLNARTLKDAHPLPHQADCLAALGGNAFFSTMDLTSGFYNIPMCEEDKKYTAFTTPTGLYEYNRMPQGLCNSPASFMRMMLSIFGDLNFTSLLCYLDDLLVFAPTEEEALGRLRVVFQKVRDSHLKLSPKKCHLLRKSVKFLGHVIDQSGVSVDPTKVDAVSNMPRAALMEEDGCTPSVKKLKSFLGMVFFYQSFIPGCSAIAKPLFALTAGMKRKGRAGGGWHVPEADHCRLEPCMPFILSVDASLDGLGAVLSQLPAGEDKARPIAFASKTLSKSQQRYPAHRLEFLALKWSVTEKFGHWLKGHDFTVWTDNNPLTHILTKPKLDAYEQRWVAKLSSYNFDLKYIPGPRNIVADALSRDPFASSVSKRLIQEPYSGLMLEAGSTETDRVRDAFRFGVQHLQVVQHSESALATAGSCSSLEVKAALLHHSNWETAAGIRATHLIHHVQQLESAGQDTLPSLTLRELEGHQLQDPAVSSVLPFVVRRRRPSRRERCGMDARSLFMLKSWERLKVQDGILYRETRDPVSRTKRLQLVLPTSLRGKALEGVHDLAGHQGQVEPSTWRDSASSGQIWREM
ncbi:hypothetical protein AAFF_G00029680 [Aldrovandia affinis]|uniref:Reverse transcriptase domain-containing protein n=1 Tax=Aldrovandia affinis TaxID=143900 RepID=A0AAD7S4C6_9TELE|nr:hypothetical protein AAFF_G00029680 [Aldrovandia affinis]